MRLTNEQMDYLRVLSHELMPAVQVGAGGLTTFVLHQIDHALATQELVKVRVPFGNRRRRGEILDRLAPQTSATLVERANNAAVLYRRADSPVIELPPDTMASATSRQQAG
jgi:putative YhbY family RNA-binding protein